ncbi:N-carbamoyl-l-amino acid hydrolase [Lasiodiplodia theobromae]|uniref:N-carbamoyl-l-amino acid hydrolase n=1 Tax=Lasiodiplodia theobromae TaxID=45133 RepID=UPI0015C3C8A4|nr:N-carbamoyl-l-amino acid hydrolase [Lasiodiplodia theobromae]KAF4536506.1 N-carbamoyl-l-amino acid hydrolase [Lasiodiplodia theobromae]
MQQLQGIQTTPPPPSDLKVNGARLMETLHHTCSFGTGERWGDAPTETGMTRLSLSSADKHVRNWLVATTKSLGCTVTVDAIGNIFAVRPGRRSGSAAPATFAGSHLDTQPTGGRYDGILGVVAGVEMLRVLAERGVETEYPVGVVNWTNEEGARFPISMMGSAVWAGAVPVEQAYGLREVGGGGGDNATLKSELERIGYLGATPASYRHLPMGAHFELHIEQGPVLEAEGKKIGVVEGVQAYKWFTVDIKGREAHTGTTPLSNRTDALLLASKLILHSHRLATAHNALASTGILKLSPGSTNTIPGAVSFSLDIRSPSDSVVLAVEKQLKEDFARLAAGEDIGGLQAGGTLGKREHFDVQWRTDSQTTATVFHEDCVRTVREAAMDVLGGKAELIRNIASGAGHDSVYASRHCPTSMIFVPCREGISHNPTEWANPEDCETGAQVLLQSVLKYDQLRKRTA